MKFPLYDMDGNKLTSLKGEVSSFYSLKMPDIEQMDSLELNGFISSIKQNICNISPDKFFKIYSKGKDVYLNTSSDLESIGEITFVEEKKPLEVSLLGDLHSSIDFYEDYFICNGIYRRMISVRRFPLEIDVAEFQGISDFVLIFSKIENVEAKNKLNLKRRLHFSQLFQNMKNIESENAYSEAESLLEDITNYNEALFKAELYFIVSGNTKNALDVNTREVVGILKEKDCDSRIESRALASVFNSQIAGVEPLNLRTLLVPASFIVNLLPLNMDYLQDSGINFKSRSRNDLYLNIFDHKAHNFNCLITGSSGQGKSVLANKILMEELRNGASGVVLDLGNSFLKNVRYSEGNILSDKINPFSFKDPVYLREFILSFIDVSWDQKEQGRLLKKIKELVECVQTFSELIHSLENDFEGISLYFEDVWEYITDDEYSHSKLIYCDLGKYSERIKRPLIIYLIECFKHQDGKRVFIFDECWNLLENNASYIAECFRTFRKYNASAIAISQNIDDFSQSDLGKVIIQNTYFKFLFRQTVSNNVFLSSYEKDLIHDLRSIKRRYSEFVVLAEGVRKIVRFIPTPLEYELFSSDSKDCESFSNYYDEIGKFFGFQKAIENYTEAKYLGGSDAI